MTQNQGFVHNTLVSLSEMSLKKGRANWTRSRHKEKEIRVTRTDSLRNWPISCPRTEPIALRMPTSFARFSERAVLRFIKLIQASNNTNTPIAPKSHRYFIWPPTLKPSLNSEYRCQRSMGKRNRSALPSSASGASFLFRSLISRETFSKPALGVNCTYVRKVLKFQLSLWSCTQSHSEVKRSQGPTQAILLKSL